MTVATVPQQEPVEPQYEPVNDDGSVPPEPVAALESTFPFIEGMGEAGGIAFTTLRGASKEGTCEINLTGRGRNASEALDNLIAGIKHAKTTYGLNAWRQTNSVPQAAPAKAVPAVVQAAAQLPGAVVKPVAVGSTSPEQAAQLTAEAHPAELHIERCNKLVIVPQPDDKVTVELWKTGRKYAESFSMKGWKRERVLQVLTALGAFTLEHLATVAEYEANFDVAWAHSTTAFKKNGEPYQNVMYFKPV